MNLKFLNKSQVLRKYDIFYKTRILTDTGLEQRYENLKKIIDSLCIFLDLKDGLLKTSENHFLPFLAFQLQKFEPNYDFFEMDQLIELSAKRKQLRLRLK